MAEPTIRGEIVKRVEDQLKRIQTANTYTLYGETKNYFTNLGTNVSRWRSRPFTEGEQGLVLRDLDEPKDLASNHAGAVTRNLHIQVEIVVSGQNAPDDLLKAFADVEAALGEGRESVWGDITSGTRPKLDRSLVEQESQRLAGGIVEVYIDYPTLAFRSVL